MNYHEYCKTYIRSLLTLSTINMIEHVTVKVYASTEHPEGVFFFTAKNLGA